MRYLQNIENCENQAGAAFVQNSQFKNSVLDSAAELSVLVWMKN